MNDPRPVWFLDVDGVIAPVGEPHGPHAHNHANGPANLGHAAGMWMCWDTSVIERVAGLHRDALVEVVWLTSWGQDAPKHVAPLLGLPTFAVCPDLTDGTGWAKASAARAYLAAHPGRPFVWTDDHLTASRRSSFKQSHRQPSLMIQPVSNVGLTARDLDRIEAFARRPR